MFQSSEGTTALLSANGELAARADQMSAAAAARIRRSVRRFTEKDIPHEDIRRLLELTGRAPSAFNAQPWRFVVVRDLELKTRLMHAANHQAQIGAAPVVIALYADMEDTLDNVGRILHPGLPDDRKAATRARLERMWGGMTPEARAEWANAQANIALGYLLLLAQSEGYATSPMLGFQPAQVRDLLGIPPHATITALVAIGHAADDGAPSHRIELDEIASFR